MPGIRSDLEFAVSDRIQPMFFLDSIKTVAAAMRKFQMHIIQQFIQTYPAFVPFIASLQSTINLPIRFVELSGQVSHR